MDLFYLINQLLKEISPVSFQHYFGDLVVLWYFKNNYDLLRLKKLVHNILDTVCEIPECYLISLVRNGQEK